MMFTEVPFIERFAAARKAGFDAVEFLFPYDYSPQQIQQQLVQNHLTLALFNTAPGDINAGEWGLSALPGREHDNAFMVAIKFFLGNEVNYSFVTYEYF